MIFITLGQVHNRSKEFENAALFLRLSLLPTLISHENEAFFLRLGLPSTLISHENGDFWKRSSNHRNLKTTALCFRAHRKHLENEGFRKRRGYDNRNISLPGFYSNTNPKWSVIVTLSNFSGIVCCGRKTFDVFSVQNLRRTVDKAIVYSPMCKKFVMIEVTKVQWQKEIRRGTILIFSYLVCAHSK